MELSKPHAGEQHESMGRARSERAAELFEPRLVVRLRARASRLKLDRLLAAGAAQLRRCWPPAPLSLDRRTRQRVAACLERFAFTADRPPSRVRTLPSRGAVRPNKEALLDLARTLRHGQLQYARGIAMLELILADGTGPAYTDRTGDGLARQLALAVQGLTGCTTRVAPQ